MAELLLRGAQTVGELRGRAARMEPIKDLSDLRPTLDSLEKKGLILYLTPQGRGCVLTHALYQERELDKVRREASALQVAADDSESSPRVTESAPVTSHRAPQPVAKQHSGGELANPEIAALRGEINDLKRELAAARSEFESTAADLRKDLAELNRQLGN